MKFEENTITDLKIIRDQIALEFFSTAPAVNYLAQFMPGILNSFKSTGDATSLPPIVSLKKDQEKFLKLLHSLVYTQINELKAFTPEGMKAPYLEYLKYLVGITNEIKTIEKDIVTPYSLFLAQMVSDKGTMMTSKNYSFEYSNLEKNREKNYKGFAKFYDKNSYKAETNVKSIVERNADWFEVFKLLNQCEDNLKQVNRVSLNTQIKQCTDYLEIINNSILSEERSKTTKEAAERLSNGAYQVARECEQASAVWYRFLAIRGSVENTMNHITNVMG